MATENGEVFGDALQRYRAFLKLAPKHASAPSVRRILAAAGKNALSGGELTDPLFNP